MSMMITFGLFTQLLIVTVFSHSWLHCSDYDGTITGQDFSESKCNGYIRQWSSKWGAQSFGTDRGVNYFGSTGAWCQSSFFTPISSMYDSGYSYATWNIGDTVTLVWPAKNHANYDCFNYIPDTSMKLYYNPNVNPTSDLSNLDDWDVLRDFFYDVDGTFCETGTQGGTDGCGFQNCPSFCDNTDKAPCFGELKVTRDDFPDNGFYTLMWYWIFNSGNSPYTTCFEVYITDSGSNTDNTDNTDDTDTISNTNPNTNTNGNTNTDTDTNTNAGTNTNTDTDTNTNSNENSNTDDTDTESVTNTDSNSDVGNNYLIQIPILYYGASYNKADLINGANDAFTDGIADFSVSEVSEGSNAFNATIQTNTNYAATVTIAAYSYIDGSSLLCDSIENEFGKGSCEVIPGDIRIYVLTSETDTNTADGNLNESSTAVDVSYYFKFCTVLMSLVLVFMTV